MELKKMHWFGIGAGVIIISISFLFLKTTLFFFILWSGILIGIFPFVYTTMQKTKIGAEEEEMFLEFTRNLFESVRTGTPISKSIVNMKKKSFGVLSKNIEKLANQITMGIPLKEALHVFANDVDNKTISRVIILMGQAEKAGGNIGDILEAVAKAVSMSGKLKKERKATISTLVVQGYIIFFVFIIIVLVMQFYIVPMISGIANLGNLGISGLSSGGNESALDVSKAFLYLLIVQGLFSGLTIGKLSEGNIRAGVRHSFTLTLLAFLIYTVANAIFGK